MNLLFDDTVLTTRSIPASCRMQSLIDRLVEGSHAG
jgi:hypothetical protein